MIVRRVRCIAFLLVVGVTPVAMAAEDAKVLRLALPDIAYLDPQQITDLSSSRVANVIFEGLYQFDYLATPARVVPNTAAAMPEISADGRTWTIRIKPGIFFASAPAFKGKPRELVAQDYVYSITRLLDPNLKRGGDPAFTDLLEGARPVIDAAKKSGKLDYGAKIEGLQAVDRHTLRLKLTAVDYTVLERLAQLATYAVAREAVEAAGDDVVSKPVGTGPFRLREWTRGSRVVLEAHPGYRSLAFPASDDPARIGDFIHSPFRVRLIARCLPDGDQRVAARHARRPRSSGRRLVAGRRRSVAPGRCRGDAAARGHCGRRIHWKRPRCARVGFGWSRSLREPTWRANGRPTGHGGGDLDRRSEVHRGPGWSDYRLRAG